MSFSHSDYAGKFLFFPLLCIVFLLPVLISVFHQIVLRLRTIDNSSLSAISKSAILGVIVIFLIINNISTLVSGGVWLCVENEQSAVTTVGEITQIQRVGKHEFQFVINGEFCTIIELGDFVEKDHVIIEYLPQSGYVLSIQKLP